MLLTRAVRRLGAPLAVLLAVLAPVPAIAAAPAVAPPPFSAEEWARALAQPAVVFVEFTAEGIVRNKASLEPVSATPVTVAVRCSGFVVHHSGVASTLRSCVAPTDTQLANFAFEVLANVQKLEGEPRAQFFQQMRDNAIFTGKAPTDAPQTKIFAQANSPSVGEASAVAWPAEVVQPLDTDTGLALIRITQVKLPVVEVAQFGKMADVLTVNSTMAMGYAAVGGQTLALRSRPVTIAGQQEGQGLSEYLFRLEEELPWETRGGMVIDMDGRVVGAVVQSPGGEIKSVHAAEAITTQLSAAGLANELGDADRIYRQGLEAYFAGRYTDAMDAFDQVGSAQMNETATAYRAKAAEREETEGSGGESSLLLIAVIVLGLLLAGAVVAILVMLKQRKRTMTGYLVSASPYDTGDGNSYLTLNYPMSAPPGYPTSGVPEYYDPAAQPTSFPGFPGAGQEPHNWSAPTQPRGPVGEGGHPPASDR
jgi:hypothetical protein